MPNTRSAKKAFRGSLRKRQYNNHWKKRIKSSAKTLSNNLQTKKVDIDILNKELSVLQKVLDKASKNKVIHKNKAARLKSRYAKKVSAHIERKADKSSKSSKSAGKSANTPGKKSKS